jgi:lipoteichoic acid synthase
MLLGHAYTSMDRANIPILIHLPKQENGVYCATPAGQVDLLTTIADALGLDLTGTPHFGRSLFDNGRPLLIGRSGLHAGSFINDRLVCVAGADLKSSQAIPISHGDSDLVALTPTDKLDWQAVRTMQAISDEYVRHLPKRTASTDASDAIIPRKLKKK